MREKRGRFLQKVEGERERRALIAWEHTKVPETPLLRKGREKERESRGQKKLSFR